MHDALLSMGFTPTVRIAKTRRTGSWDTVTLCVDVADGLGIFLELETMAGEDEPGAATQERLYEWASSLGVAVERVTQAYDSLLRDAGVPASVAGVSCRSGASKRSG
ncbi:CYTH domain-containing protein [Micromonospora peucetia]|uniref:CYTH domain-containing protein n=1 Tax=Micromonospora peucetia TaxID=47871 RepID=UPI00332E2CF1